MTRTRPAVTVAWVLAGLLAWRAPDAVLAFTRGLLSAAAWLLSSGPGAVLLAVGLLVTLAWLAATAPAMRHPIRHARGW